MKKLIPGILATALCFTCFATACGETPKDKDEGETPSSSYNVESAAAALKTVYGGQIDELDGRTDFDVPNTWGYQGAQYTVTWTATAAAEGVTCPITLYPDGDVTEVAVNKLLAEETQYYLTATVTAPDKTSKTTPILGIVNPIDQVLSAKIGGNPTVGTEYVLSMFQGNLNKTLYLTGNMSSHYYQTSDNSNQAKTILVEENTTTADVTNDYYMYYLDGETKTYLNVVKNGTYNNVVFEETASSSWVYTADIGTMLTTLGEGESAEQFFLGTYDTHNTMSACAYPKYKDNFKAGLAINTNRADVADSVRVNDTLAELSVPAVVAGAYTQKLATSGQVYPEATVTWALAEGTTAASLNTRGSKLTTTDVTETTEITLTATVTSGDVSQTKTLTFNVVPNTEAGILAGTALLNSGDEFANEVSLTGTVSKIVKAYDAEKGTVTFDMTVGESTIQAYSAIGGNGVSPADVKVGATATVTGILKNYSKTIEFDYKCVIDSLTALDNAADKVAIEKDALSIETKIDAETLTQTLPSVGASYNDVTIAWAVTEGNATIDGSTVTYTAEDGTVKLTATLTCDGVTETKEFSVTVSAAVVENPELSTTEPYKMYINAKGSDDTFEKYYMTGEVSSNRFSTTLVATEGADVYAELSGTSYKFYVKNADDTKSYFQLSVTSAGNSSAQISLVAETTSVFDYDATTGAWYADVDGTDYYLGSFGTYTTISSSKRSFINAENAGVSQYAATLVLASEFAPDESATDAEKVEATLAEVTSLGEIYVANGDIQVSNLGTSYPLAITWAVTDGTGITVDNENGLLKLTATEISTVTLTASVTSGSVTDSKSFTVKVVPNNGVDIVNATYELASYKAFANKATLSGIIISKDSYNNPTILVNGVESKPIICYKLSLPEKNVGEVISVNGILKNYNGKYEFDQGCTLDTDTTAPAASNKALKAVWEASFKLENDTITVAGNDGAIVLPASCFDNANVVLTWKDGETTITSYSVAELPETSTTKDLTVTATFGTGETQETATKTITIKIKAASSAEELSVTLTTSALEMENAELFTSKTIDNITFSSAKGTNSGTDTAYYTNGSAVRVYADNTFTISAAENFKIVSIEIVTSNKAIANATWLTNADTTATTGLGTHNVTIIPVDGTQDVVICNNDATSGNWRVNSIKVVYEAVTVSNA